MQITIQSPFTGKYTTMDLPITEEQLVRWKNGELAQNVFSDLSPEEREFLISGLSPKEQKEIFHEER